MDIATLGGLILGLVLLVVAIVSKGSIMLFIDPGSVIIVVGGMIAAVMVSFPLKLFLSVGKVVMKAVFAVEQPVNDMIALLVKFAERARREGILALEKQMEEVNDEFLRNGIQLAVDGTEPELLRDIMMTELSYLEERHKTGKSLIDAFGALGPAWGMIGTLVGLVLMLANLDDPDALGPGMAVALITTFYGAILANLVFIPMASKLERRSKEELLLREMMIMGILSIQSGDNPRIVEQKLNSFIAPSDRQMSGGD
jgi:chemotaxis protein MotA